MAGPESDTGRSAEGGDLASTDMSAEPSSRTEETSAPVSGRTDARLEDDLARAKDRHLRLGGRVRQLPEAQQRASGPSWPTGPRPASWPAARRPGRLDRLVASDRVHAAASTAPGRRARWTGSSGRSCRPPASSASTRWARRSIPACTRRSPPLPPPIARAGPHGERHVPAGLPVQGHAGAPRAGAGLLRAGTGLRGREGLLSGPRRSRLGQPGRDQEGLSPARQAVPSGRQPQQSGGRRALQGDLRGAQRALRRRQAEAVRPDAPAGRVRRHAARGPAGAGARRAAPGRATWRTKASTSGTSADWATSSPPSSAGAGEEEPRAEAIEAVVEVPFRVAMLGGKVPVTLQVTEAVPHLQRAAAARRAPPGPPVPSARAEARSPSVRAASR